MKKIILYTILSLIISCKQHYQNQDNSVKDLQGHTYNKQIEIIREFYLTFYGSESNLTNYKLRNKYVSRRILKKIDSLSIETNSILDYDPFIQGQDYDGESIKESIKITPLKDKYQFKVSFILFGFQNEKRTEIDLLLEKSGDSFLISAILNDDLFNFQNKYENILLENFSVVKNINGTWRISCDEGSGSLNINNKNVFMEVNSNQIYIDALAKKKNDSIYNLYLNSPKELGAGGMRLDWDNFSKDSIIGKINYNVQNNIIKFSWLGFYNEKTKKRDWTENSDFQLIAEEIKDIKLTKCK